MPPPDSLSSFFSDPRAPLHRRYEVLRAFFLERQSAAEIAERFGYAVGSVYSMTRDFRRCDDPASFFFRSPEQVGRPPARPSQQTRERVIELRRANLSLPDIKARLDAESGAAPSQHVIGNILREEGFGRLPRRTRAERALGTTPRLRAPTSVLLRPGAAEGFQSERAAGILCLLPWVRSLGLDRAIESAGYPGSRTLPALQSVLAFVALKLSDARRYSADDLWCMDRGLGLFAGLNVLPKTASLSACSDRTTRKMNRRLLASMAAIWKDRGLASETANLDFTVLPHWGDDATLDSHWSSTRNRTLVSVAAALAQDPDSGLLLHADTRGGEADSQGAALEFLDFSRSHGPRIRYLAFDSRFCTYAQLARLEEEGIRFVTIRRRGKRLVERARSLQPPDLRQVRVPAAGGRTRLVRACDETVRLPTYGADLRQITIVRGKRRRPSLLLTNDFDSSLAAVLRRYARRWLIEKSFSEQLNFFHLNRLSSSIVIKVDFDLTMTVLAYNLLRLLAANLPPGYRRLTARSLYERMLCNAADISLTPDHCRVALKKKRDLPALLEALQAVGTQRIPWIGNRAVHFEGATRS